MSAKLWERRLAACAAVGLLLTACGGGSNGGTAAEESSASGDEPTSDGEGDDASEDGSGGGSSYHIGVVLQDERKPFDVALADGITAVAEENGVDVLVTYGASDLVTQLNEVDDLITMGVDGIIMAPLDEVGAEPAYEAARDAGIPIMSIADHVDHSLEDGFIGANWVTFGGTIAGWICDEIGGEGEVAMIMGPAGLTFVTQLEEGFKTHVEEECPGMDIVFETNTDLVSEAGLAAAQDAVTANPNLAAIYANNDDLAVGSVIALEEMGKLGDVVVTGFNGDPGAIESVQEGRLDMTVALRPYHWGRLGMETMLRFLNGEEVEELTQIEALIVDQDNIDSVDPDDLR